MNSNEDWIYKDLTYTRESYFSGEQIFPNWENIFAVIIGAFFITYFTIDSPVEKMFLCVIGLIFSLAWFCLASRNYLYSKHRCTKMWKLEEALGERVTTAELTNEGLTLFSLGKDVNCAVGKEKKWYRRTDSWIIRQYLPKSLAAIWVFLLIYTLVPIFRCSRHVSG